MIPWQYKSLLEAQGIFVETEPEPLSSRVIQYSCCDEIDENAEGMLSCFGCGKVFNIYKIVNEEEPCHNFNTPLGASSHIAPQQKRRIYKRLTHFKEHVRRFLGARFTELPQELLDEIKKKVDLQNRDCYNQVKAVLKQMKKPKLYKEIFTIIYKIGGVKSKFTQVNEIYKLFSDYDYQFELMRQRGETNRHNGFSFYMLLDIFLKELGYESFYYLPCLKRFEE